MAAQLAAPNQFFATPPATRNVIYNSYAIEGEYDFVQDRQELWLIHEQ